MENKLNSPFLEKYSPNSKNLESRFFKRTPIIPVKKIKSISRDEIIQLMSKKHAEMIEKEKIRLNNGDFRRKIFLEKIKVKTRENLNEDQEIYMKNISRTPEIKSDFSDGKVKVPKVFDFRSDSHKSRYTSQAGINNIRFTQIPSKHYEIEEITKIKSKLANRGLSIGTNNLEEGLYVYQNLSYDRLGSNILPRGGEYLMPQSRNKYEKYREKKNYFKSLS